MPLFSIIVRTCDRPWFLARALKSIASQNIDRLEVIVVNDAGDEAMVNKTVNAAVLTQHKIKVIHNERRLSRGGAWNAGARAADGELLASLDDDDTWESTFLSSVAACIKTGDDHSLSGVVVRSTLINESLSGSGYKETSRVPFNPGLRTVGLKDLLVLNRFTNNAFVFSRAALDQIGFYREDLAVLEDWEFNVRFAAAHPIKVIPKHLANYHRRKESIGSSVANTLPSLHHEMLAFIKDEWLREDLKLGRFGKGALSLLAEVQNNRGLHAWNRLASLFGW